MAALNLNHTRYFTRVESFHDLVSFSHVHHVVRVLLDQPLDYVDLLQGSLNGILVVACAADVRDPKLTAELSFAHPRQISVAARELPVWVVPQIGIEVKVLELILLTCV